MFWYTLSARLRSCLSSSPGISGFTEFDGSPSFLFHARFQHLAKLLLLRVENHDFYIFAQFAHFFLFVFEHKLELVHDPQQTLNVPRHQLFHVEDFHQLPQKLVSLVPNGRSERVEADRALFG